MKQLLSLACLAGLVFTVGCNDAPKASPDRPAPSSALPVASAGSSAATPAPVMDDCPHGGDHAACGEAEPPAARAGANHYGKAFSLEESQPLSSAAAEVDDGPKTVQVKGTVDSVCKKRGCWMVLRDGETTARIFTHAGDFLLPKDTAKGRTALVEGTLEARTMSRRFAKHLAEDEGKDPAAVEEPTRELVIQAQAVALR